MMSTHAVTHADIALGISKEVTLQVGNEALRHGIARELGISVRLDLFLGACCAPDTDLVIHCILSIVVARARREHEVTKSAQATVGVRLIATAVHTIEVGGHLVAIHHDSHVHPLARLQCSDGARIVTVRGVPTHGVLSCRIGMSHE